MGGGWEVGVVGNNDEEVGDWETQELNLWFEADCGTKGVGV